MKFELVFEVAGASLDSMSVFEYEGTKFVINTNFSGFLGIVLHD